MWLGNVSITKHAFSYSQAILSEILGWRKGQCWWFFQWWAYLESRTPLPLLALCPTTPIHPSPLGRLREHFPRLFPFLVAGNTQHTQLNMKHGINSMACDLYAKCHMLHLHETEQETGLFFCNVQLPQMKSGPKGISNLWLWFHMSNSVSPSCLQPSQTSRWNPRLWTVNQMSNWRILFPSQLWHCRPGSPCSLLTMKEKSMQAARPGRTGRRNFQRRKRRKKRYTTSSIQEEMFSVSSLLVWLPESNHLSDNVGGPQHIYPWLHKLIVFTAIFVPPASECSKKSLISGFNMLKWCQVRFKTDQLLVPCQDQAARGLAELFLRFSRTLSGEQV